MVYLIVLGFLGLSTIAVIILREQAKSEKKKETPQDEAPKQRKSKEKVYI